MWVHLYAHSKYTIEVGFNSCLWNQGYRRPTISYNWIFDCMDGQHPNHSPLFEGQRYTKYLLNTRLDLLIDILL